MLGALHLTLTLLCCCSLPSVGRHFLPAISLLSSAVCHGCFVTIIQRLLFLPWTLDLTLYIKRRKEKEKERSHKAALAAPRTDPTICHERATASCATVHEMGGYLLLALDFRLFLISLSSASRFLSTQHSTIGSCELQTVSLQVTIKRLFYGNRHIGRVWGSINCSTPYAPRGPVGM